MILSVATKIYLTEITAGVAYRHTDIYLFSNYYPKLKDVWRVCFVLFLNNEFLSDIGIYELSTDFLSGVLKIRLAVITW